MTERSQAEVGALVADRRRTLGYSEKRFMELAQVDRKTLGALEDGSRWPQEETRFKVERVLRWPPGSIERLRDDAGWLPTPLSETPVFNPLREASDEELLNEIRCRMKGARRGVEGETQPSASTETVKDEKTSDDAEGRGGGVLSVLSEILLKNGLAIPSVENERANRAK